MPLHGYDVSRWNDPARPAPADFMFARASYGMLLDSRAEAHIARAVANDVRTLGLYHWLSLPASGAEQAALFLRRATDLGDGLMLAVDVEDPPRPQTRFDRKAYALNLLDFARYVARTRVLAVYGSTSFLTELRLSAPEAMAEVARLCLLWLADWTPPWDVPPPWEAWALLQTGAEKGIDRDEFAGTAPELRAIFGLDFTPPTGCALPGPT